MSNSIDTKVVQMKMDNASFLRGIASTLTGLKDLQKGLNLKGAASGLNEVNKAANSINTGHIADNVQKIASRFSTLGIVAVTALAGIATQAISTGAAMVKNLTVAPLLDGFREYELKMGSIQTILANTQKDGTTLKQVTASLDELNHYADKTIYNFGEMTKNIGLFTNAGIKLEDATSMIKGFSNAAAASGTSAEGAAGAAYQLSQALSAGKITLMDWRSLQNVGMGNANMKKGILDIATAMGTLQDKGVKAGDIQKDFNGTLEKGWLTADVMSTYLKIMAGDMTAAQMKSLGLSDAMIRDFTKQQKTAEEAATKVRTLSQLMGTLKEAVGSGWAATFDVVFGNFDEATTLFSNISGVLGKVVNDSANARNKLLSDWKALGGRTVLIEGLSNAFEALVSILKPIKDAFRQIFPPATGKQLFALTKGFADFTKGLKIGSETAANLKRTFAGFFAIFSIGISILKGIFTTLKVVFDSISDGSGGVLEFTGSIGDWLVALDKAIKSGEGFSNFFKGLGKVISAPIKFIQLLIGFIGDLLAGTDDLASAGKKSVNKFVGAFDGLGRIGNAISAVWSGIITILKKVFKAFEPLVEIFSSFFDGLSSTISNSFASADYSAILDSVNTGLLGGIALLIAKFLKGGINLDVGGGLLSKIGDTFEGLTGTLGAMQAQLKASALIKIAGAVALLTVSVVALSLIDSKKLASALSGLTIMFTQLLVAMAIMDKIASSTGFLKLPLLTASMIGLAIAIDLLVIAVSALSRLNWSELAKGLTGTAVLLTALGLFTKFSGTNVASGASLILLALAINILVKAVQDLSGLSWSEIAKGLVATATLLGALALFTKFSAVNKGGVAQGAGLVLLALAIKVLASAMEDLGKLSWTEIAKGLVVMAVGLKSMSTALASMPPSSILSAAAIFIVAQSLSKIGDAIKQMGDLSWTEIVKGLLTLGVSLTLIGLAIKAFPPTALTSAAALLIISASLVILAKAMDTMGGMTWGEIAKSLVVLAGALIVISAAMALMTGAVPGAQALIIVAAALWVLQPVLQAFSKMSWVEMVKGLLMLAGVFAVIGVAGLLLAPIVPVIAALGVAIAIMGAGMLAAGAGMFLFGLGLTAISVAGSAAVGVLVGAVRAVLKLLPEVITALGETVIAFARAITKAAPAVGTAIGTVLNTVLNLIIKYTPKIGAVFGVLLNTLLGILVKYTPKIAAAGLNMLIALLGAISKNIGKVVKVATDVVVNFLNALSAQMPRIAQAGANLIVSFVNSVAGAIRANSSAMNAAGANLASAIIQGMVSGITGGISSVTSAAKNLAQSALDAAKNKLGINSPSKEFIKVGTGVPEGFIIGVGKLSTQVVKSAEKMGDSALEAVRSTMSDISSVLTTDADFNPVIRPVLDLTDVQKTAGDISKMLATNPLALTTSAAKATDASAGWNANQAAQQDIQAEAGTTVTLTQVNNSPKPLNNVELYRQTNNLLSTTKGALKK